MKEDINEIDLPCQRNNVIIDENLISDDSLHTLVPKLNIINEKDRKLIQKNNLTIQSGRFNKIENAILQRNWDLYLKDYLIPNPLFLFGYFHYESYNKEIKQHYHDFAEKTKLLLRLAKGLPNRTIYQVYCRARVLFSGLKQLRDFSDKDRAMILNLYKKHGDRYTHFCEQYGYNPKCAREVVRYSIKANGSKINNGPWTYEELMKLKSNVEEAMKEYNLKTYERIPWSKVAQNMNRSDIQCRQRFFTKVMYMMVESKTDIDVWDEKLDLAKLIALLKYCNFLDEYMIDWDYIKEKFSTDCFNILARSWRKARMSVPNYLNLTLPEVVDFLYKNRVEKLYSEDPMKMKEIKDFVKACS